MKDKFSQALGRALAYCSAIGDGTTEGFVERAAWELHHECAHEFSSLALIVRRGDGSSFVGRPRELPALPVETILSLLVEESGAQVGCRVRDHALDTVRFIDARFRTSIILRVSFPKLILPSGEAALWLGLQSSATPKRVELAQRLATTCNEWLAIYAPVLQTVRLYSERLAGLRARIGEMVSIAHDAKAPLGALRYMVADLGASFPDSVDETARLRHELSYVEQLLAKFAPRSEERDTGRVSKEDHYCDVGGVIRRVCDRFLAESIERGCSLIVTLPHDGGPRAGVAELELERVVSNIVGNAVRYAGTGDIKIDIGAGAGDRVVVKVADNGPGIPQRVIDRVARGVVETSPRDSNSEGGWGVGLVSCKLRLAASGGDLRLNSTSSGSIIEIDVPAYRGVVNHRGGIVPQNRASVAPRVAKEAKPVVANDDVVDLILVDDDTEHTASLERIVRRTGLSTSSFSSVEDALSAVRRGLGRLIVCDARMPDGGAERLLQLLSESGSAYRCAVMSGESNDDLLYRYAALGAREFFPKPVDVERLVEWAKASIEEEQPRAQLKSAV